MRHKHKLLSIVPIVLLTSLAACVDKTDADFQTDVSVAMHATITEDLVDLAQATRRLQAAAPNRAWNPVTDAAAITDMQNAWKVARIAWEHVEGAIAPAFAGFNVSMDARYEDFLPGLGPTGDDNPFDGTGVVGMHAIERILFAAEIRPEIVAFESSLPGYKPAAYPATDHEAIAFKTQLVQRLIDDTTALSDAWQPTAVDLGTAYLGQVSLMNEQQEKVNLAVTGAEESRYANVTLFDLRNNLDGTQKAYDLFRDWIRSKSSAESSDQQIQSKFDSLRTTYQTGDSLPDIPKDWSSEHPTQDNLNTAFGALWQQIRTSVDPHSHGSVVFEMNQIATMLGFPEFVEQ
jgi:iron uptake system component EfeO